MCVWGGGGALWIRIRRLPAAPPGSGTTPAARRCQTQSRCTVHSQPRRCRCPPARLPTGSPSPPPGSPLLGPPQGGPPHCQLSAVPAAAALIGMAGTAGAGAGAAAAEAAAAAAVAGDVAAAVNPRMTNHQQGGNVRAAAAFFWRPRHGAWAQPLAQPQSTSTCLAASRNRPAVPGTSTRRRHRRSRSLLCYRWQGGPTAATMRRAPARSLRQKQRMPLSPAQRALGVCASRVCEACTPSAAGRSSDRQPLPVQMA